MASTITRDTWTDDTGSAASPNLDGTVLNNDALQDNIYARIDEMFAGAGSYATFDFGAAVRVSTIIYVNDTANAFMTVGATLNQGSADNEILTLKSSDVAHGVTDVTETDTYAAFTKAVAASGGLRIRGLSESDVAFIIDGVVTTAVTTKATGSNAACYIDGKLKGGTSVGSLGSNGNIVAFGDSGTTRFILDADGDSHQDVGTAWTNFDDGDDIERLDAVAVALAREGDPLRDQFARYFEESRAVIDAMPGKPLVTFNADGRHFVNMSRLAMLLTGAVRQLARQQAALEARLLQA